MRKIIYLFSFILFHFTHNFSALSQTSCGTQYIAPPPNFYSSVNINSRLNPQIISIPIQIHIIRNSSGIGGVNYSDIVDQITIANQQYTGSNLKFTQCGTVDYIDNSSLYEFSQNTDESNLVLHQTPNVVNIYYANTVIANDGSEVGGYSFFPFWPNPQNHYVIIASGNATDKSTLGHELGHFFGLYHTHETSTGVELVDGSNCSFAGDLICDTPADPGLQHCSNSSCQFTCTSLTDPNGQHYSPLMDNMMSYVYKTSTFSCGQRFTNGQLLILNQSYQVYRTYLNCSNNIPPVNDNCNNAISLVSSTSCNYRNGTLAGATNDGFPTIPSCDGYGGTPAQKGVFYSFVAQSASHTIEVVPTGSGASAVDAVITIYAGTNCFNLNEIPGGCGGGSGSGGGQTKTLTVNNLTIGQAYWVRIYDYGSVDPIYPDFKICITHSGTISCNSPTNNTITNVSQSSAIINWTNGSNYTGVVIKYKENTSSSWLTAASLAGNATSYNLNVLTCGKIYNYDIIASCSDGSNVSTQGQFSTLACTQTCSEPNSSQETSITETSAILSWNNVSDISYWEIRYKESTSGLYNYVNIYPPYTSYNLTGLNCGTNYDWSVEGHCNSGNTSSWLDNNFSTLSCPQLCYAPYNNYYSDVTSSSVLIHWSNDLTSNYTTLQIKYRPLFTSNWTSVSLSTNSTIYSISGLICNTTYEYRIEVSCSNGNTNYVYGQFAISPCAQACNPPYNNTYSNTTQNSATLNWNNDISSYYTAIQLVYKEYFSSNWITLNLSNTTTSYELNGLSCGQLYEYRIEATCASGNMVYVYGQIPTLSCSDPCYAPFGNTYSDVTQTSVTLNWNNDWTSNYTGIQLQYKDIFSSNWNIINLSSSATSYIIYGLVCNTTYEYKIVATCSSGSSNFVYGQFITDGCQVSITNAPTLIFPPDWSTQNNTIFDFTWSSVANATKYHYQLSYNSTFTNIAVDVDRSTPVITIQNFPTDGTVFFWRVKAGNDLGWGPYSEIWRFNSGSCGGAIPPNPQLLSPSDWENVEGNYIQFNWSDLYCATDYFFQITKDPTFYTIGFQGWTNGNSFINLQNFSQDGSIYYWKVSSWNYYGYSYYSSPIFRFYSVPLTAVLEPEKMETGHWNIYPNPNNGQFTIELELQTSEDIEIKIMDMLGRILLQDKKTVTNQNNKIPIDLSNVSSGTYLVSVIINGENYSKSIMISK